MIYIYRLAHLLFRLRIPVLPWILKITNRILFSVSLPPSVEVGKNVTFGYQGLGIVVHKNARIGSNVIISPNVVIGGKGRGKPGAPVIEDDVVIGAGACILGNVRIGRGAVIGANSVVLTDIEPQATVVGIPARSVTQKVESVSSL
ncbi:serine O-acetyltransferase [Paraburkholderia sacchari]|uniref:Serine acetyltransferase n=1 Tax=Paraburkholderia sacchari TaxID=159450 RepID=A0A8T6ZB98_9BURK|nr:DapH/DapD/GlmU-related protein [Paraburkholderia sacchari]NLP62046.1 serine acetyltransferase [Paraburkholderia sacchari]